MLKRTDASIVQEVLKDDPNAFEELVVRYQRQAYAIASALGVAADDREDVVQESLLKAFRDLPALRDRASFGCWFLTIVRNESRRYRRQERNHSSRKTASQADEPIRKEEVQESAEALEGKEFRDSIWQQVRTLPEGIRETLFLYYYQGRSTRAVARSLGISRSAVKHRLRKGRDLLRSKLWREVERSLEIPSSSEWRRKARRLSLVTMATIPSTWAATAAPAGVTVQGTPAGSSIAPGNAQGMGAHGIMTGTKIAASLIVAVALVSGVVYVSTSQWGEHRPPPEDQGSGLVVSSPGPETNEDALGSGRAPPPAEPPREEATGDEDTRPVSVGGKVTDLNGKGIPGAKVMALDSRIWSEITADGDEDMARNPFAAVRSYREVYQDLAKEIPTSSTDDDGVYTLRELPAGEYRLLVSHPDYIPRNDMWAHVEGGERVQASIRLFAGRSISGRIVDGAGRAVGGALVLCESSESSRLRGAIRLVQSLVELAEGKVLLEVGETTSRSDGSFRLHSLEPVPHDVKVLKDGFAVAVLRSVVPGNDDLVLTLLPGVEVVGRILDSNRKPRGGVEVVIRAPEPSPTAMLRPEPTTDEPDLLGARTHFGNSGEDGHFRLVASQPGVYEFRADAEWAPPHSEELRVGDQRVDLGDILLAAERAISGVVVDRDGLPLAGVRVWAERSTTRETLSAPGRLPATIEAETKSDTQGQFELRRLRVGSYDVRAFSHLLGVAVRKVEGGQQGIRLSLGQGAALRGVVLDAADRSPVTDARVFSFGRRRREVTTGDDGRFQLLGWSDEVLKERGGRVSLLVFHPDYRREFLTTQVDDTGPVEVLMRRAGELRGIVVDEKGIPVGQAQVRIEIPGVPTALWALSYPVSQDIATRTAPDGSFRLTPPSEPPALRYEVLAVRKGIGTARLGPLEPLAARETASDAKLVLVPGVTVAGRITDAEGGPIADATVRARRDIQPAPEAVAFGAFTRIHLGLVAYTDESGSFRLEDMECGAHTLEVSAPGFARRAVDVTMRRGEAVRVDVSLESGVSVSGRVVDDHGEAVVGAEVLAFPEDESLGDEEASEVSSDRARPHRTVETRMARMTGPGIAAAWTDGEGAYELRNLPERALRLVVRGSGFDPVESPVVRPGLSAEAPELVVTLYGHIVGRVVDGSTDLPVTRFEVRVADRASALAGVLSAPTPTQSTASRVDTRAVWQERRVEHPDGHFQLKVSPGKLWVDVRAVGYVPFREEVNLRAGAEVLVAARLATGSGMEGTVSSTTGEPIEGAQLYALVEEKVGPGGSRSSVRLADQHQTTSDEDGHFAFQGLGDGKYVVTLRHSDYYATTNPSFTVPSVERLDLVMQPAGKLEGVIHGLPAADSVFDEVVLEWLDGHKPIVAVRGQLPTSGKFRFESLRPGRYELRWVRHDMRRYSATRSTASTIKKPQDQHQAPEGKVLGTVEIRAGETQTVETRVK